MIIAPLSLKNKRLAMLRAVIILFGMITTGLGQFYNFYNPIQYTSAESAALAGITTISQDGISAVINNPAFLNRTPYKLQIGTNLNYFTYGKSHYNDEYYSYIYDVDAELEYNLVRWNRPKFSYLAAKYSFPLSNSWRIGGGIAWYLDNFHSYINTQQFKFDSPGEPFQIYFLKKGLNLNLNYFIFGISLAVGNNLSLGLSYFLSGSNKYQYIYETNTSTLEGNLLEFEKDIYKRNVDKTDYFKIGVVFEYKNILIAGLYQSSFQRTFFGGTKINQYPARTDTIFVPDSVILANVQVPAKYSLGIQYWFLPHISAIYEINFLNWDKLTYKFSYDTFTLRNKFSHRIALQFGKSSFIRLGYAIEPYPYDFLNNQIIINRLTFGFGMPLIDKKLLFNTSFNYVFKNNEINYPIYQIRGNDIVVSQKVANYFYRRILFSFSFTYTI